MTIKERLVIDKVRSFRVAGDNGFPIGPPVFITKWALNHLLETIGNMPSESGGKLWGPKGQEGIDVFEFDNSGSGESVFRPDSDWGNHRLAFWLRIEDSHIWVGDIHSHPTHWNGFLSKKAGFAKGDLGYIEAVFDYNPEMKRFFSPIITFDPDDVPVIWPWAVEREGLRVCYSPIKVVAGREYLPYKEARHGI
ncbi:MAG: hypothetical protein K8T10_15805 [Candidatus Eremiobacteraeota bacterium]|nr:hypothetical protein [Candidatus Eremiobacteraeota bacterium]